MDTLLSFYHAWNLVTQVLVECCVFLFVFLSLNVCKSAAVALANADVEGCGRRWGSFVLVSSVNSTSGNELNKASVSASLKTSFVFVSPKKSSKSSPKRSSALTRLNAIVLYSVNKRLPCSQRLHASFHQSAMSTTVQ